MKNVVNLYVDRLPASEKFERLRMLAGYMEKVTPTEFTVLFYIWMRTIHWGKESEYISIRQFQEGVEKTYAGKIPLKRRAIQNNLKSLLEAKIIERKKAYNGYFYCINWGPFSGNSQSKMHKEKSKNKAGKAGVKKSTSDMQKIAPGDAKNCASYNSKNNKYKNNKNYKNNTAPHGAGLGPGQAIQGSTSRNNETMEELSKLWTAEIKKNFPEMDIPTWTRKDFGMISALKKQLVADGRKAWPFLKFAIENWQRIGVLCFSWMKDPTFPKYPDAAFLVRFKKIFLEAYAYEKFQIIQMKVSPYEREIAKFKRMGYTQKQAEEAYAKDLEHSKNGQKHIRRAEVAEIDVRALAAENTQLKKENVRLRVRDGERLIAQDREREKMNLGSNVRQKRKYDKEGYAVFNGEDL